jgi:hypothetical protein
LPAERVGRLTEREQNPPSRLLSKLLA